jgi:hypothetical protein
MVKGGWEMSFISKLKTQDVGTLLAFLFYAATGIIFFAELVTTYFPPHLGVIAIFSLLAAFGLIMKRSWATWFIIMLFFVSTTFSVYTLYYYALKDLTLATATVVYLILTWAFTAYTYSKRRTSEA